MKRERGWWKCQITTAADEPVVGCGTTKRRAHKAAQRVFKQINGRPLRSSVVEYEVEFWRVCDA